MATPELQHIVERLSPKAEHQTINNHLHVSVDGVVVARVAVLTTGFLLGVVPQSAVFVLKAVDVAATINGKCFPEGNQGIENNQQKEIK